MGINREATASQSPVSERINLAAVAAAAKVRRAQNALCCLDAGDVLALVEAVEAARGFLGRASRVAESAEKIDLRRTLMQFEFPRATQQASPPKLDTSGEEDA